MFRSRANEKDHGGNVGVNRDVNVPLVKTQDGKDFDSKRKSSSNNNSIVSGVEGESEEAVQAQESKRRKRRIMKIAVYFMFGIIAIGVFAIWLFHKDSVESLSFDTRFVLTVKLRSLVIKNSEGDGVLYGDIGRNLLATPYDHCWDDKYESYEENCLYWRKMAKLRVVHNSNDSVSSCYTLKWEGLKAGFLTKDCFYLQHYHWYGFLTNSTPSWPITGVHLEDIDYYNEYPEEQTENLVPIWFGSQGVSIFVDSSYPFSVSWNVTDKRQFCISSKVAALEDDQPTSLLQYDICQASSMKDVYLAGQQHRKNFDVDFDVKRTHKSSLLPRPIRVLSPHTNMSKLLAQFRRNESQCSLIELQEDWEGELGNLSVAPSIADDVDTLIKTASNVDCHVFLPISTFFSYKSQYFEEGVTYDYFVRDSLNLVTRMIQWRGEEGAILDVSNPQAAEWFLGHIKHLIQQLGAKALKLFHLNVPPDSMYYDSNMTHLDYTRIFYRDLISLNITIVLEMATGFIPLPVYIPVRMTFNGAPGSACLDTSIPYSLILGLSGYPLLIADASSLASQLTSEEMFISWLKLAIFFPILEVPSIPILKKKDVQDFLREALALRNQEILPYMTQVWEEQPDLALIRPMWWVAPNEPQAQTIRDQFMVGDRLLVAPVLCEGMGQRQVYLPHGLWKGHGMKPVKGPQVINVDTQNFNVIPYFWYHGQQD